MLRWADVPGREVREDMKLRIDGRFQKVGRYQMGAVALITLLVLGACIQKTTVDVDTDVNQGQEQTSGPSASASPSAPLCSAVNAKPGTFEDRITIPQGGSLEIGSSPIDTQGNEITNEACLSQFSVVWVPLAGPCTYSAGTPSYANAPLAAPVGSVCKANAILSGPGGTFTRPLPDLTVTAAAALADDEPEPEPSPSPTPDPEAGVIDR